MRCRVAVIDSGVNKFYKNRIAKCLNYIKENHVDKNGHGTKCVSIIDNIAPETDFTVLKILNKNLQCSSSVLCQALTDLLTMDIDIINLSLSTAEINNYKVLNDICRKLYQGGKLIIASKANDGDNSYPAESEYVLGVCGSLFRDNETFWYKSNGLIQIVASKTPTILKVDESKYSFYGGNSKATACMTGVISKNWDNLRVINIREKMEYLSGLSVRTDWKDQDIQNSVITCEENDFIINKDIELSVKQIFRRYLDFEFDDMLDTELIYEIIGFHSLAEIFHHIVDQFKLEDVSGEFNLYDFTNLKRLCKKIEKFIYKGGGLN